MEIQRTLDSDVVMASTNVPLPATATKPAPLDGAVDALGRALEGRATPAIRTRLFGIVQGGMRRPARRLARRLTAHRFRRLRHRRLSVGERRKRCLRVLDHAARGSPADRRAT